MLAVPASETGQGIRVGVIDSGFFPHPYYAANNLDYKPTPTPSSPTPTDDRNGHGTAICYNIFATAPGATVMGFKQTTPPENALEEAADAGVDIISCSWGWDHEQSFPTVELTIKDIVREGKIVLFAAGNGHRAWPGSMPEVISVGGVFRRKVNLKQAITPAATPATCIPRAGCLTYRACAVKSLLQSTS